MGYRWRTCAGLLAACALAGCGGGHSDKITSVRNVNTGPTGGTAAGGGQSGTGKAGKHSGTGSSGRDAGAAAPIRGVKGKSLSPAQRRNAAARITGSVLAQLALPFTSIAVTPKANSVTVAIPKAAACTATQADVPRIKLVVGKLVPFVSTVNVVVAGTRSSLAGYLAAHCRPRAIPSGAGRVVFDRSGAGSLTTAAIRIRSRRWTIGYSSQAISLRVIVVDQGSGHARGSLAARGRAVGQKAFAGPGTFKLRIVSPAIWTLRVRDGV